MFVYKIIYYRIPCMGMMLATMGWIFPYQLALNKIIPYLPKGRPDLNNLLLRLSLR